MSTAASRRRASSVGGQAATAQRLLKRRVVDGVMPSLSERATTMQCATCPSLAPCPTCAANEMCQLSVPPSCAQCPKNACVPQLVSKHTHASPGSIGGAVGGVMAALALAGVLFMFWRKRHQRAKAAVRRARAEAKVRLASSEKFRPGGGGGVGRIAGAGDIKEGVKVDTISDPFKDPGNQDGEEDNNSADVEWTELREDGLTTFRTKPGQEGNTDASAAAMFKRHSMGAATHLSRITEGAEEEEELDDNVRRHRSLIIRDTIQEEPDLIGLHTATQASARGHTSSASIGNEQNQTRSRRSYGGRELSNPFADWSDVGSFLSGSGRSSTAGPLSTEGSTAVSSSALDHSKWSMPTAALEPPTRAHRAVGAPLIDLQGKPKGGQRSPSTRTVTLPPSRPTRLPDLNLRLEDGVEPGKVGEDLRKQRKPLSALNGDGATQASPISPTSPRFTKSQQTLSETEAREAQDFPSELAKSDVYHKASGKADGKRMSAVTTRSADTLDTMGTFEYVMSAPQIVTPLAADGAKRMQLKQGKAQLVRSLSAVRREQEEQRVARSTASTSTHGDAASDSLIENPFSDTHSAIGQLAPSSSGHSGLSIDLGLKQTGGSLSPYRQPVLSQSGVSIEMGGYGDSGRPYSGVSEASLPFVDRPIREPTDRSPTDAHPRGSMATIGSQAGLPRYFGASISSDLDLTGAPRSVKHDSNASSLLDPNQPGIASRKERLSGTSIGGLSVLDEIPFQIGGQADGENGVQTADTNSAHVQIAMPDEPARPTSQASSAVTVEVIPAHIQASTEAQASGGNPLLHHLQTASPSDEQPKHSPFHDSNVSHDERHLSLTTQHAVEARRTSVPSSLAEAEELQVDMLDDDRFSLHEKQASRVVTNPKFEQIRLRHELDNYPFANDP